MSMQLGLGLREWGAPEFGAALLAMLGWPARQRSEARIGAWFEARFGSPALVLNSGSSALELALALLQQEQPERKEVVLPALACPALGQVLARLGLHPRYADIGPDLNTPVEALRPCLGSRTLAVIMVHAYGHPADSAGIAALCRERGIALIDDAAQRIDPASRLGLAGDFGVFSFAQSKSVVCGIDGAGGVLLLNNPRWRAAAQQRQRALRPMPRRTLAWLEFALAPQAPRLAYYLARLRGPARRGLARIAGIDAAIALPQLASLARRREQRAVLLAEYRAALAVQGLSAVQMPRKGSPGYLARLQLRLPAEQRQACREALAARGFATRLPYRLPSDLSAGACPAAEQAAAELLELPLPRRWQAEQLTELATCLAAFARPATQTKTKVQGAHACSTTGS